LCLGCGRTSRGGKLSGGRELILQLSLASKAPLPGATQEVQAIQNIFRNSQTLIEQAATLEAFKQDAPRFSILHLATHGCFQPNGCPNLGLEANTILFANNQQFPIADAALLGLNTRLLVLSACQTAQPAQANGEEISGLAYVLERAGARAVMATLWSVEDQATRDLMINFYQNLNQGQNKAEALQQAKIAQIHRHPYFWSAFLLIGDPR
jgi:CHAT domain-containing protein